MNTIYLKQVLIVGMGGFVGSGLRYIVSGWAQRLMSASVFPWGTLAVNVIGCLFIGFLGGLAEYRGVLDPGQRLFLMIGVLGGFTTFSTFAFETLVLLEDMDLLRALANIMAQISLGLVAALLGYVAARYV